MKSYQNCIIKTIIKLCDEAVMTEHPNSVGVKVHLIRAFGSAKTIVGEKRLSTLFCTQFCVQFEAAMSAPLNTL